MYTLWTSILPISSHRRIRRARTFFQRSNRSVHHIHNTFLHHLHELYDWNSVSMNCKNTSLHRLQPNSHVTGTRQKLPPRWSECTSENYPFRLPIGLLRAWPINHYNTKVRSRFSGCFVDVNNVARRTDRMNHSASQFIQAKFVPNQLN